MEQIVLLLILVLTLLQTMFLFVVFTTITGIKISLPFQFGSRKDTFRVKKQTKPLDQFVPDFKRPLNIEFKDIEEDKYTVR